MPEQAKPVKPIIDHQLQRSYGRVNGRKLRAAQQDLLDRLPEFSVDVEGAKKVQERYPLQPEALWLEIGFGGGEHLAYQARNNPDIGLIGCEPFTNGVVRLLREVTEESLQNVRIFHGDARLLLDELPDNSISRVFILFPDPWPKAKHYKKRFIQTSSLDVLARIIPEGGQLRIATDHSDYAEWILEHLESHPNFVPQSAEKVTDTAPSDWCNTRYQEKALVQGRKAVFFDWVCQK